MKDFDVQRQERAASDREFKIAGETFTLRSGVRPEVLAEYESINQESAASAVIGAFDGLVLAMIEPDGDSEARWKALRGREEDPLTLDDIGELVKWAMETMTSRPTQQPSPSRRGPRKIETTSTDGSSSQDEKAA